MAAAVAALALAALLAALPATAAAQTTSNPTQIENSRPGTDAWQIGRAPYSIADDANSQIKGYASETSVNKGGNLSFKVSVNRPQKYTIDIYRLGCYADDSGKCLGGRLMRRLGPHDGVRQPACKVDGPTGGNTGLTECDWTGPPSFTVPTTWTSGIYVAVLTNEDNFQNYMQFVVRDDARHSDLLYQQPIFNYQAYNNYPDYGDNDSRSGKSLYDNKSGGGETVAGPGRTRAVKVSFDRPYAGYGASDLLDDTGWGWEGYYIRWMEKNGYDVTYSTNADSHRSGQRMLDHKGVLSVGHDEYWSKEIFDAAEKARDAGVNLGFFGANDAYWQVRMEPSSSGGADRVMVSYKNTPNNTYETNDPVSDPSLKTVRFQDPPVNRPSQTLLGVSFLASTGRSTLNTALSPVNTDYWAYAGTGFTGGGSGANGIVGYEADKFSCEYPAPNHTSFNVLSRSRFVAKDGYADDSHSTMYRAPSGAWVFAAGTMSWSWALDREGLIDSRVQKLTKNILDAFSGKTTPSSSGSSGVPECADRQKLTFEGGSLDDKPEGADKALGSMAVESSNPLKGSHSAKLANVPNSYLDERLTAVDDLDASFLIRLGALPATDARIAMVQNHIVTAGNLVLKPDGRVCLREGNGWVGGGISAACSSTRLVTGTTYRVGLHQIRGTGGDAVLEASVAQDGQAFGAPFVKTTSGTWTTRASRLAIGTTTNVALDAIIDDVDIDGAPLAAPARPTGLKATASTAEKQVQLDWSDNADNETSYVVERSRSTTFDDKTTFQLPADAKSYLDKSVDDETTYHYRVKAVNAAGSSAYSDTETVTTRPTPPAAPTSLSSSYSTPSATTLAWTDNSANESGFILQRSRDSTFSSPTEINLPQDTTSYDDAGLSEGPYYYRVKATKDASSSAWTSVVRGPRIKDVTFEDGTPTLVHPATGVSRNSVVLQESTSPIRGAYSARVPGAANAYLEQSVSDTDDLYVSFYMRLGVRPVADSRIAQIMNGPTALANVWIRANGTLCLKYGNAWSGGSVSQACTPIGRPLLATPQVYRVVIRQKPGDGTSNAVLEGQWSQSDPLNPGMMSPLTPFTSTSLPPTAPDYWQTTPTALRLGATLSSGSLDATFDDIKLDESFVPGPSAP